MNKYAKKRNNWCIIEPVRLCTIRMHATAGFGKEMTVKVDEKKTGGPDEALKLENQLCFPLYACAKEVVRRYRKPLAELGLTYTQYIVMMVLWEFGGMSEGQLGCRLHLDSGTLAPLLKRLEKTGLIDRRRPADDERMLMVSLTEEGAELKIKAREVPASMRGCIALPDEDLLKLKELLDRALKGMCEGAPR